MLPPLSHERALFRGPRARASTVLGHAQQPWYLKPARGENE